MGYVYAPAFIGCVIGSVTSTKFGAELAKKMSVKKLKLAFAPVLLAAAAKMIGSAL